MATLKQSTTYTRSFLMVSSTDHITGLASGTVTVTLSKAGAAFGAAAGTVTAISSGWYQIALTTADTGTVGDLAFHATATGADPTDFVDQVSATILGDTLSANVLQWNSTNVASPSTAGIPEVNVKNINNVATTSVTAIAANIGHSQQLNFTGTGASALVKSDMIDIASAAVSTTTAQIGTNTVSVNAVPTTSVTTISAVQGHTQPINFTGTGASALVKSDTVDIAGSAVSATTAQIGVNVASINSVAATSVTTVSAVQGHTQPLNFTGTGASALVKSDMTDIAGSAVSATTAQIGTNLVNIAGSAVSTSTAQIGTNVVSVAGGASNIKKNQILTAFEFLMTDATTHSPKTTLTVTATRSIDGAAFAGCTNAVSEVANGIYAITLSAADLNGNVITLRFTASGADDRLVTLVTQP